MREVEGNEPYFSYNENEEINNGEGGSKLMILR